MKRAFLTGEEGFIAKNLIRIAKDRIRFINAEVVGKNNLLFCNNSKNEFDFTSSLGISVLKKELIQTKCNVIIHNGATVGTDVCALNPREAILNNVYGTYNIATVAKELKIPIVYIGTTVIYDTQEIQDDWIDEDSPIAPRTLYATTKYEGELIIKAHCQEAGYCVLRPLFCYGGEGDMNSLIAKTIFNDISGRKKPFKIFLDPSKYKDYMHVDDFCEAILIAALNHGKYLYNNDFNISADNPIPTYEIAEEIKEKGIDISYIRWIPETDYLGNHRVSNTKFLSATNWIPKISITEGIGMVKASLIEMNEESKYNPFKHLDEIEQKNMNIEEHYNFKG